MLAVNASVFNEDNLRFWLDERRNTFLTPTVEVGGHIDGTDDPDTVIYEIRV